VAGPALILHAVRMTSAMTGARLGCAVAPRRVADVISTLNTNAESCTTHFVQWAGIAALTGTQEPVRRMLDEFRARRDAVCGLVNAIPGMSTAVPQSTFYVFPDVTDAVRRKIGRAHV